MDGQPLSTLFQKFKSLEELTDQAHHHPFASSFESSSTVLQDLVHASNHLSHSLAVYSSAPITNPKLVSILRQHSALLQTSHISEQTINQSIGILRKRSAASYGEDIPLDRTLLIDWCISRLEAWGSSVGMEAWRDDGREGRVVVVLGGKVVVVDVDFAVNRADPHLPRIDVVTVKTSYAISNNIPSSNSENQNTVETLLADSIRAFCDEAQRDEALRRPQEAARLGKSAVDHLSYLMTLDNLAQRNEGGGIRWFADVHRFSVAAEKLAKAEALSVASSLSSSLAPLDIFLMRSHTLPLPYLISPSISFLICISTQAYLSLLRTVPSSQLESTLLGIDIPLPHLRQHLSAHPRLPGSTLATLALCPVSDPQFYASSVPIHDFSSRPTFFLAPADSDDADLVFPQINGSVPLSKNEGSSVENARSHVWVLDFTEGGKHRGVVMSQTRMRDIEVVVNPFNAMNPLDGVDMIRFSTGSWVDLLLSPVNSASSEWYTSVYLSPTGLHPPLQLRLMAPEEPGFFLERVPVRNMKEVWGVLEVVREQCWLNEIITGRQWVAERSSTNNQVFEEETATEDELQAVLTGTVIPQRIPVNIYLPSHNVSAESLFDTATLSSMGIPPIQPRRPRIVMTSPECPPISGLVEITVGLDEMKSRGVFVDIRGALGTDLNTDVLEEVCRRGGALGLPGRVWASSHATT